MSNRTRTLDQSLRDISLELIVMLSCITLQNFMPYWIVIPLGLLIIPFAHALYIIIFNGKRSALGIVVTLNSDYAIMYRKLYIAMLISNIIAINISNFIIAFLICLMLVLLIEIIKLSFIMRTPNKAPWIF